MTSSFKLVNKNKSASVRTQINFYGKVNRKICYNELFFQTFQLIFELNKKGYVQYEKYPYRFLKSDAATKIILLTLSDYMYL